MLAIAYSSEGVYIAWSNVFLRTRVAADLLAICLRARDDLDRQGACIHSLLYDNIKHPINLERGCKNRVEKAHLNKDPLIKYRSQ